MFDKDKLTAHTAEIPTQVGAYLKTAREKIKLPTWAMVVLLGLILVEVNFILGVIFYPEQFNFGHTDWSRGSTYLWLIAGEAWLLVNLMITLATAFVMAVAAIAGDLIALFLASFKAALGLVVWAIAVSILGAAVYVLRLDRLWEYDAEAYKVKVETPKAETVAPVQPVVPPVMPEAKVDPVAPTTVAPVTVAPHASAYREEAGDYPHATPTEQFVDPTPAIALPEIDPPSVLTEVHPLAEAEAEAAHAATLAATPTPPPAAYVPHDDQPKPTGPRLVTDNGTKPDDTIAKAS